MKPSLRNDYAYIQVPGVTRDISYHMLYPAPTVKARNATNGLSVALGGVQMHIITQKGHVTYIVIH